jgi:predicted CopG family antitoxin
MASVTISLSSEAYKRLKDNKAKGESFSDVVLREVLPGPARTTKELVEQLNEMSGKRKLVDEDLMKIVETGRKRPSRRRLRHAA